MSFHKGQNVLLRRLEPRTERANSFWNTEMKVSFLGHRFPLWPSRLGKMETELATQLDRCTVLCKTGEKCSNSIEPWLASMAGKRAGWGRKCQQYTKKKWGGVGNPITSASSFTGQRETDSQEFWETNEISESWVRRLPLEVRQGGKPEVWVEKWRAKSTGNIFFLPTGQVNWTKRKSNHSFYQTPTATEKAVGGDGDISTTLQRQKLKT